MILFLCTGEFPETFSARVPLLFPNRILTAVVPALIPNGRLTVLTPSAAQTEQTVKKWEAFVPSVTVIPASPYEGTESVLEKAAATTNIPAYFEANQNFHLTLWEIAGNRWLLQVIQDLRKVLKLTRYQSLSVDGRLKKSMEEHRELLAAITAKDPDLAEKVMKSHLIAGSEAMAKATSR